MQPAFGFGAAPQLELRHHLVRQGLQGEALAGAQAMRARMQVEHAQGAQRQAVGRDQLRAGIKTQTRRTRHQRIAGEARVLADVGHHHHAGFQQRVLADRIVERHLAHAQSGLGLEPLAAGVDEVDRRDRRFEQVGGEAHQVVDGLFRGVSRMP
jgi:hypothetical protein